MPSRRELANAIRALSMDAVQRANSGHPGMPMGMADIAQVLWQDFLSHYPEKPDWPNRDRFILSNGHGSMLQYSLLHLTGYDLTIEDIKNFRQMHSKTPGHPEYRYTPGVETTTGPLGQGMANAVGMALAERMLAAQFNRPDFSIVDHYTYVFLGDGCLMEGVSHEACSLAGTFGLGKLIAFWDDNEISIDGRVEGWFTDHTPQRFESYGWHVIAHVDGHNADEVLCAIEAAREVTDKPTLICCRTTIGYGAPKLSGSEKCHGAPLGEEEIAATRKALGWSYPPFEIPKHIYEAWDARAAGQKRYDEWQQLFAAYEKAHPELASEFKRRLAGDLPKDWKKQTDAFIRKTVAAAETVATRKASQKALEGFGPFLPEFIGGSADLTGSNLTLWSGSRVIHNNDVSGNYIHYGVREFGMSAMMNGMALYGGFLPYGGTFLVFSDYARNALRMAAIMKQRVIFIYSHDSIGLGEDGPTHQPIEHLASLRLIPNMSVWRPCDAVETAVAWRMAIERSEGPTCLALSRQNLPAMPHSEDSFSDIARGGYVLWAASSDPQLLIIATGSEVALAVETAKQLAGEKIDVNVISLPSVDQFESQTPEYQQAVLPKHVHARLVIEAGSHRGWEKYAGPEGKIISLDHFGESAPAETLFKTFGFSVAHVVAEAKKLLKAE